MQRRWLIGGVAVLAAAAGGTLWAVNRPAEVPAKDKDAVATLSFSAAEVARASQTVLPRVVEFSGPLVAPSTATVRAKAAGTLTSLKVVEGSRVHKGEALGTLDLAELNARLSERVALAESAKAQWAQAERSHASNEHLAQQQFISPIALEASKAALNTARAQVNAAQAQVEAVRVGLHEAALVAPIAGIVAKRQALAGEKVAAEQAIVTLVDLALLEMAGSVGTHEVASLKPGMPVQVMVEGDPRPVAGRLARIAPSVDAGSRSIGVAVEIANPEERLRAGQFAMARVSLPQTAASLTVPVSALASASGQEYVWTLEQGKLFRRSVVTGRRDGASGLAEVLQGLQPGVLVLATRFENLREGAAAKLADGAPASGGAAEAGAKGADAAASR